jgi:hypothetical protein
VCILATDAFTHLDFKPDCQGTVYSYPTSVSRDLSKKSPGPQAANSGYHSQFLSEQLMIDVRVNSYTLRVTNSGAK